MNSSPSTVHSFHLASYLFILFYGRQSFCRGYAKQMVDYFNYVRNELEFSTRPNYPYLRKLFRAALSDLGKKEDYIFDWTTE